MLNAYVSNECMRSGRSEWKAESGKRKRRKRRGEKGGRRDREGRMGGEGGGMGRKAEGWDGESPNPLPASEWPPLRVASPERSSGRSRQGGGTLSQALQISKDPRPGSRPPWTSRNSRAWIWVALWPGWSYAPLTPMLWKSPRPPRFHRNAGRDGGGNDGTPTFCL